MAKSVINRITFDVLFVEEALHHHFHTLNLWQVLDGLGQVFQNKSALEVGMFVPQLHQLMTMASSYIHKERSLEFLRLRLVSESGCSLVKDFEINKPLASLHHGHHLLHCGEQLRLLRDPFECSKVGFEGF